MYVLCLGVPLCCCFQNLKVYFRVFSPLTFAHVIYMFVFKSAVSLHIRFLDGLLDPPPHSVNVLWVFCWHSVGILYVFCGYYVDIMWIFCRYSICILLVFCVYSVYILCVFCGYSVDSLWIFCMHSVDIMWIFCW